MKILITGGAGFIGANLARQVLETGEASYVRVLDDLSTGYRTNLEGLDVDFHEGSVADPKAVTRAMCDMDAAVHLAALGSVPRSVKDPVASHLANLTGTLHVLQAAKETGAYVVFASSSSVYGANTKLPKSELDWTRPLSPYAATKLGAEAYVIAYQHAYGLPTLAFRFFNVYGPLQSAGHVYAAVIPKFIEAALSHEPLVVHGDGLQSRDFTYISSVCSALTQAVAGRITSPHPVNLAFGTSTTVLDLVDQISRALDRPLPLRFVEPRPGDVHQSQADSTALRQIFPQVMPVPLEDGLRETIAWFQRRRTRSG